MIAETVLILSIIGIFILIARRLPDALRTDRGNVKQPSTLPQSVKSPRPSKNSWPRWLSRKKQSAREQPLAAAPAASVPDNLTQRQTLLSDEALLKEGDEYLHAGKFKEAERAYLRGVAKNPKNPKLYNRLGAIYLKQRNYRDALEAFEAARDFDATRASRHYNVALAAWHLKNRSKARAAIQEATRLDPSSKKYQDLTQQIEQE